MTKKLILLFFAFYFLLSSSLSLAQHFESSSYNIDWGNFNMTSGRKSSANYSLTDTVGQNAPGEFTKTGVKLKSGFQYIYPFSEFSFSIDNLDINFGVLASDIASTAVSILTTTTPSGHGFQIMASESSPLKVNIGLTIPDFKGDNNLANESTQDLWSSSSTYGFGYNADSSYFSSANHFKQFADISNSETAKIVDSSINPVKNHQTTITYKVNISGIQPQGEYHNYIIYTAIPNY